jgi:hypothetical protein
MVLAALGRPMTEAALRALTDCSPLGTDAFQLVEAARQLGFPASRKYTLASLSTLRDPTPSQEDRLLTRKLVLVGEALGIKVLDHTILGDGSETYCSFADEQWL